MDLTSLCIINDVMITESTQYRCGSHQLSYHCDLIGIGAQECKFQNEHPRESCFSTYNIYSISTNVRVVKKRRWYTYFTAPNLSIFVVGHHDFLDVILWCVCYGSIRGIITHSSCSGAVFSTNMQCISRKKLQHNRCLFASITLTNYWDQELEMNPHIILKYIVIKCTGKI